MTDALLIEAVRQIRKPDVGGLIVTEHRRSHTDGYNLAIDRCIEIIRNHPASVVDEGVAKQRLETMEMVFRNIREIKHQCHGKDWNTVFAIHTLAEEALALRDEIIMGDALVPTDRGAVTENSACAPSPTTLEVLRQARERLVEVEIRRLRRVEFGGTWWIRENEAITAIDKVLKGEG